MIFHYGYKPTFPKWIIYVCASIGGVVLLGCLFLCCCYIRRLSLKKGDLNKVKKYAAGEDKLSRFKYGRESNPIALPELAENNDEMKYAQDEWGSPQVYGAENYSAYKLDGQYGDDNLDFEQLDDQDPNGVSRRRTNYPYSNNQISYGYPN